jgi:hypothetical protein
VAVETTTLLHQAVIAITTTGCPQSGTLLFHVTWDRRKHLVTLNKVSYNIRLVIELSPYIRIALANSESVLQKRRLEMYRLFDY